MVEPQHIGMGIGDVSKLTGLSIDTLRYYEKEGLLPFVPRSEGGQRIYDDNHLGAIRFLTRLKLTGMPISRMREYMDLALEGPSGVVKRRDLLIEHRQRVVDQIEELNLNLSILDLKINLYNSGWTPGDWTDPRAEDLCLKLSLNIDEKQS